MDRTVNEIIRKKAKEKGVFLWEIAVKFGVSEPTFNKKMRSPFPEEDQNKILSIIDIVAREKQEKAEKIKS